MMKEFKGTPGPWEVGETMAEKGFVYCDDSLGSAVCRFDLQYSIGISSDQKQANGHLLAAAPEVLEMLSDIVNNYKVHGYITNQELEDAEQLINKALGND